MTWKCKTCGGVYEDPGADGVRYFHTCPPEIFAIVERAGVAMSVLTDAIAADDVVEVLRAGERQKIRFADRVDGDVLQRIGRQQRTGHRDENVTPVTGKEGQVKSEGKGRDRVDVDVAAR